jgi:hypothetical protein
MLQVLRPNAFHDQLVRHVPRTRHEEITSPEVPNQTLLIHLYEFLQETTRTISLHPLHQVARRHVRRAAAEQVDVVDAHVAIEDLDLKLRTDRRSNLAEP